MSDQYTSNQQHSFSGGLVDNSFKPEHMANSNYPPQGDTTSEGGYGGDAFSRSNQAPSGHGQFKSQQQQEGPTQAARTGAVSDREFEQHAGEGVAPPSEAAGAEAASSGTSVGTKARFVPANDPNNNIGA